MAINNSNADILEGEPIVRGKTLDKEREEVLAEIARIIALADRRQLDIILAFVETLKAHPDY